MTTFDSRHQPKPADPVPNGALPSICNLPFQRNSTFTGRAQLLSMLADRFFSHRERVFFQAIKGMAGIGKTQIALEFAYRYAHHYEVIWWVNAEDELALSAGYAAFARAVDLPEKEAQRRTSSIDAVRQWLQRHRNWLFVFVNAKHPDQLLYYLPKAETGHVLVTSRHQMWEKLCPAVGVLFFSRRQSVDFLLKRTGDEDAGGAEKVAERLADFPLALTLAAAAVDQSDIDFTTYLQMFEQRHQGLWATAKPPTTYPDTLGTAVTLACDQVEKKTPAAVKAATFFAFLGGERLSRSLFQKARQKPSAAVSSFLSTIGSAAFDRQAAALVRHALAVSQVGGVSVHRLVQAALRDRLAPTERQRWSAVAVSTLTAIFPSANHADPGKWATCDALIAHGQAVIDHALATQAAPAATADLMNSIGSYLHARRADKQAEAFFQGALDVLEQAKGPAHPRAGAVMNNLAALHQDRGRFETAESLLRRALNLYRTTLGKDHRCVGATTNNLASLLRDKGEAGEAERLFRESLRIFQKRCHSDDPQLAVSCNNLAVILQEQGNYDEAEQLLHRALELYRATLTNNHPHWATALRNLALVFQEHGHLEKAERLLRSALGVTASVLPPDHRNVVALWLSLADVLHERNQHQEAADLYRKALAHCEKNEADDPLQLAFCLNRLAALMHDQGKEKEAEGLFRKCLRIRETQLPADHPSVAQSVRSLADALYEQGNFIEAEVQYRKALNLSEAHQDPDTTDRATGLNNLAAALIEQGQHEEAEPLLQQALEIFDAVLGMDHPDTAAVRSNLCGLLKVLGKTQAAERQLGQLPAYFTRQRL